MGHIEQPGLLYVAATALPLLSFLILFLGGNRWGKVGAYIATGAIAGAFLLSFIGFVEYLQHDTGHGTHGAAASHSHDHDHETEATDEKKEETGKDDHSHPPPWADSIYWAVIHFKDASEPAVSLKLGYYIDGLAAVMFVMITFIATLIHIFSMGYMSEELQPEVEDHAAHVKRKGRYPRFFMFLSLFCFSMLNLVLAENLFQIFISWELVGICSYLLISFYYERRSATNAANKAFITNRFGDAGFIIGLLILWTHVGTLSFYSTTDDKGKITEPGIFDVLRAPEKDFHGVDIKHAGQIVRANPEKIEGEDWLVVDEEGDEIVLWGVGHFHPHTKLDEKEAYDPWLNRTMPTWMLILAGVGVFLGCVGKSAQFPLQVWLPDAMEGPTPVSALIHAATMVAAGVYLVGRAFPLFTAEVLLIIAYTGAITLFVAATIAIVQTDIKKVLAYSTVSQLGYMMLALGVGGWVAGLFHLITHAFFKALLFLGSGSVIYGCHHEQEMTKMGGLYAKMKITALTMLVGTLAIAGTPLFSGWYSKDAIIVSALSFGVLNPQHFLLLLLPLLTAGITTFYMFRLWFMTFTGEPQDEHVHEHAHESPWVMTIPLIILALFSIIVAWGNPPWKVTASKLEHLLHDGQPASLHADAGLSTVTSQIEGNTYLGTATDLPLPGPHDLAGILALLAAAIGFVLAVIIYYWKWLDAEETREQFASIHSFFWHKWHFDELYSAIIVRPGLVIAGWCRWFDANVIDGILHGTARVTTWTSAWNGKFDLGIVDGLVNLTARVIFGVGAWLRVFQTGFIRSYVLFMAVAAIGIFVLVSYVVALSN